MTPPSAGPTLRARLKPIEFIATALGKIARGTMSPTAACQAGPLIAVAHPSAKVKASSSQGVIHPAQAVTANNADTTSIQLWQAIITLRRSRLSATAPAHKDSSMIGSVVAAGTSAISIGDADSEIIIQAAPTDWISPPKLDARLAIQMARKVGTEKGDGAGGDSAGDTPPMKRNWIAASNPQGAQTAPTSRPVGVEKHISRLHFT